MTAVEDDWNFVRIKDSLFKLQAKGGRTTLTGARTRNAEKVAVSRAKKKQREKQMDAILRELVQVVLPVQITPDGLNKAAEWKQKTEALLKDVADAAAKGHGRKQNDPSVPCCKSTARGREHSAKLAECVEKKMDILHRVSAYFERVTDLQSWWSSLPDVLIVMAEQDLIDIDETGFDHRERSLRAKLLEAIERERRVRELVRELEIHAEELLAQNSRTEGSAAPINDEFRSLAENVWEATF